MQNVASHASMSMKIKKALTFRASSIGDCLMAKYLLENIHAQFPVARLGIVVGSRGAMIRDLFVAYPWLEVIEANRRNFKSLFYLWKNFHRSDLVVTQYAGKPGGRFSFGSKLFARILAKRGGLIGFTDASGLNGMLYDALLPHSLSDAPAALEREALRAAGIPVMYEYPTIQCGSISNVPGKFGLVSGSFIVAHLFAGNKMRGLHPDKKRKLLVALTEKLPHTRLVISGGAADKEEAMHIAQNIEATVIAGEATLQEMMNLIAQSRAVVSVDTGMAHITAQLGKPLVVMRSCVGANWWLPEQYGKDARITVFSRDDICALGHDYSGYAKCLGAIDMDDVAKRAKEEFPIV